MDVLTQRFLVLGVSKSGASAVDYILSNGGKVKIFEELKDEKIDGVIASLVEKGAVNVTGLQMEQVFLDVDVLILSPGVPINHRLCVYAKERNIRIISEFEFGFLALYPRIVGVTGTNGKTTTVSLIDHVLKENSVSTSLVGNVGFPVSGRIEDIKKSQVCVAEVSSFQLESTKKFCPHISCVLNVTPDHLERHYTMDNYIYLKSRILLNQTASEYAVLNYDDEIVRGFSDRTEARIEYVSVYEKTNGAYAIGSDLYYKDDFVISEDDLPIKGLHNVKNVLFAINVCALLGLSVDQIATAIKTFKGVKHRNELVLEKDGIKFYNDSKSTNTASTISAIESMVRPTVLILGGSEKGERYLELFKKIKNSVIKHVVLCGDSRIHMLEDAGEVGYADVTVVKEFKNAVKIAKLYAEDGDSVLLSPACASFDAFNNYEERGERFCALIQENV